MHIGSKGLFSSASNMLIIYYLANLQIQKFPKIAIVVTNPGYL